MKRAEAIKAGTLMYVGKPCPRAHSGERYTSTGNCVTCAKGCSADRVASGYYKMNYRQDVERHRAVSRAWHAANREYVAQKAKEWVKANPAKRRAIANNYKHRRRAIEAGGVSSAELCDWTTAQPKVCFWCDAGCADDFHVDHIQPLSKGGPHELDNMIIACRLCNLRKNARDPETFMEMILGGYYDNQNAELQVAA